MFSPSQFPPLFHWHIQRGKLLLSTGLGLGYKWRRSLVRTPKPQSVAVFLSFFFWIWYLRFFMECCWTEAANILLILMKGRLPMSFYVYWAYEVIPRIGLLIRAKYLQFLFSWKLSSSLGFIFVYLTTYGLRNKIFITNHMFTLKRYGKLPEWIEPGAYHAFYVNAFVCSINLYIICLSSDRLFYQIYKTNMI